MKVKLIEGSVGVTANASWKTRMPFDHFQFITVDGDLFDTAELGEKAVILFADSFKNIAFKSIIKNLIEQRTLHIVILVVTNDPLDQLRKEIGVFSENWRLATNYSSCIGDNVPRNRLNSKVYKGIDIYANAVAVVDINGVVLHSEITPHVGHQINIDNVISSLQK